MTRNSSCQRRDPAKRRVVPPEVMAPVHFVALAGRREFDRGISRSSVDAMDVLARQVQLEDPMKLLILVMVWLVLLVLCWPLALLAMVLAPLVWLLALPFLLVGLLFAAMFALLKGILFLPARLLGYRG